MNKTKVLNYSKKPPKVPMNKILQRLGEPIIRILDFPELRQIYNYDCGVTALQEVLCYYGFDVRESIILDEVKESCKDIIENGIKLSVIKSYAEKKGLKAEIKMGMDYSDLISCIDKKIPVIVLLQAWRDKKSPKKWKDNYKDGHYVVAIGYSKNSIIFEDPSSFNRTFLNFKELSERWHDIADDNKTHVSGVGIIIGGKPDFKSNKIDHMD
jgi:predicted double-glycine peptidase